MAAQELERVRRVQRLQDARLAQHAVEPGGADGDEPGHRHRAEKLADLAGAARLKREEREQHADRDRHHEGLEGARADFQAFDRREDRDGRGEHRVAVEERRSEHAYRHQREAPFRMFPHRGLREGDQRHDAAFAAVVGAHDQHHVFQRHHDHQRPEDRRQPADDIGGGERDAVIGREGFLDRVERARADVAEHDAERGERERRHRGAAAAGSLVRHAGYFSRRA